MAIKHGLGRGLSALIQDAPVQSVAGGKSEGAVRVKVDRIHPSPLQPRRHFSREALEDLVRSIQERGVLQPPLVRKRGDDYELIAGERRWRAAKEAGISEIPVVVMDVADHEALEIALIENLQREDLNPIEEAEGFQVLAEKFGLTQDEIALRVHKGRATVTNALRLLSLPEEVRRLVGDGNLSPGHAKVLLGIVIGPEQKLLAERASKEGWSVRELEKIVDRIKRGPRKRREAREDVPASHLAYLVNRLHQHFGTSVHILPSKTLANGKKVKGTIQVDFYSNEDLDRILELLGLTEQQ
jgi:ParB family transcriptional regulator, chromosome partitioning protein